MLSFQGEQGGLSGTFIHLNPAEGPGSRLQLGRDDNAFNLKIGNNHVSFSIRPDKRGSHQTGCV